MLSTWFMAGHAITRFGLLGVFCLLITGGAPVSAQEIALPDVEALFTDAAEVTFVQPIPDPVNDLIYLYEDGAWQAIENPEPERVIAIQNSIYRIFFSQRYGMIFEFEPIDSNEVENQQAILQEGEFLWSFPDPCANAVRLEDRRYICNPLTGELSPPYPSSLVSIFESDLSPDGRYYLLLSHTSEDQRSNPPAIAYSYELATGDWRYLGEWQPNYVEYPRLEWITDTDFMYVMDEMQEWSTNYIVIGDVTQENSIQEGLGTKRFPPLVSQDPPGLEAHYAVRSDGHYFYTLCYEDFYDAERNTIQMYRVDYLCEYGLPITDGSGDFLFRRADPYGALVRRNLLRGTQQVLYRGAFERLGPVSPNGRWGLIEIATDRTLDYELDDDFPPFYDVPPPYQVMDLTNGTLMGEVPGGVFWLGAHTLLDGINLYQVDTTQGQISTTQLPREPLYIAPEVGRVLIWNDGLWLYDVTAFDEPTLLMDPPAGATFDFEAIEGRETIRISWLNPPNSPTAFVFDLYVEGLWQNTPYRDGVGGPETRYH
jgi:hypothetical protein